MNKTVYFTFFILCIGGVFVLNTGFCATPYKAVLVDPVNNTQNIGNDVVLKVFADDSDGGTLTVTFHNETGTTIDTITTLAGMYVETTWNNLKPFTYTLCPLLSLVLRSLGEGGCLFLHQPERPSMV